VAVVAVVPMDGICVRDYSEEIHEIHYLIRVLPIKARKELWRLLEGSYPGALVNTDPAPEEVWDDPENGFGRKEIALLRYLWNVGDATEPQVIKRLWPGQWPAQSLEFRTRIRQRLRKLEQRIRDKLAASNSDWFLSRPHQHTLELRRYDS
jgi:hypothetical protein